MAAKNLPPEQVLWDKHFAEDVKSGRFFWVTNKSIIDFERGNFKKFWQLYDKIPADIKLKQDIAMKNP